MPDLDKLIDALPPFVPEEPSMTTFTTTLLADILTGVHDDNLDALSNAIDDRNKALNRASFYVWKPGDKATLHNLRPKYMIGAPVTIIGRKVSRIEVRVDQDWLDAHPQSRFRGVVTVQPDMLKAVGP